MIIPTSNSSLSLRLLQETDAEELFALTDRNRLYLRQWLPWLDSTTSAKDTHAFIQRCLAQHTEGYGFVCTIIFNGNIIGVLGHNSIDLINRISYPGYWLSSSHAGKGFMTVALRTLIEHAFSELNMNRIDIRVATGNSSSQAVCNRLGFKKEGTIRQAEWLYDHYVDHTVNGLLKANW
jgi:ribosomal-protein-serine acetyltransferase